MLIGFYRADVRRLETALVGALATWCHREGYELGTPYRDDGINGALETMIAALAREDVTGVVVPSLEHLGPLVEQHVGAIKATGKQLFVADATQARR